MKKAVRSEVTGRSILADVIPLQTPYVVTIYIGDICNFKCKYCEHSLGGGIYAQDKHIVPEFMTWEQFIKVADQLKKFPQKIKKILFSSIGEPLLNKNLPNMIEYIKKNGVAKVCEVVTNASLLTHKLSKDLIDSGLDRLCVSIQGVSENKYKEISQVKIDYENLREELGYFYRYSRGKCKLHIKTVNIALDDGEDEIFYQHFGIISDTCYIDNVIPLFQNVDYSDMVKDVSKDLYGNTIKKQRVVCSSIFFTLFILPNGEVVPCCVPPYPLIFGNIQNEDVVDIWNGNARINFLKYHLEGKRFEHQVCRGCMQPNAMNMEEDDLDHKRDELLDRL